MFAVRGLIELCEVILVKSCSEAWTWMHTQTKSEYGFCTRTLGLPSKPKKAQVCNERKEKKTLCRQALLSRAA